MKQRLMIVWAIAHKDMLDAVKQHYLLFSLLLPIAASLITSFMVQSADAANVVNVVVYDPGDSHFVTTLQTLPQIELSKVAQPEAVSRELPQDYVGGLIVSTSFDAEVEAQQQPELIVYVNGDGSVFDQQIFRQLLEQQVWGLGEQPARIVWNEPTTTPDQVAFSIDVNLFLGLSTMALIISGIYLVPFLLVEEKEKHTLQALRVSPAHSGDIALGKAITGLIYSLFSVAILFVLHRGWQGDGLVSTVVLSMSALAMVMIGLIVGSVCRTSMQVNTLTGLLLLIFFMPGVTLVLDVPLVVTIMLQALPTYHLINALQLSLVGETATAPWQVVSSIIMLVLITLGAFGVVAWLLRREES